MICPKCGRETAGNYCSNCGARLGAAGERVDREQPPEAGRDFAAENHAGQGIPFCGDALPGTFASRTGGQPGKSEQEDSSFGRREQPPAKRVSRARGGRPESRSAGKRSAGSARAEKKAARQREERIKKQFDEAGRERRRLEQQVERLSQEREYGRREAEARDAGADGPGLGKRAAAGAAKGMLGLVILSSRAMQLVSCALMAFMVWTMTRTFWAGRGTLGSVRALAAENHYGLALYLGGAGLCLTVGALWCLWILSRKAAGGGVRLKKYDTGRGWIPFLLCIFTVIASGALLAALPADPAALKGAGLTDAGISAANGARRILEAVDSQRGILLPCSLLGAVLSLIRKILRV